MREKKDINGLAMLAASLVIIAIVIGLVAHREIGLRREQVRAQGLGLANALSRIPLARLAPHGRELGPLSLIGATQTHSDFAYAAVLDPSGETLDAVSAAGIRAPRFSFSQDPAAWKTEHLIEVEVENALTTVREFTAPILEEGRLVAQVQIGFHEPNSTIVLEAASFHATVALLVFIMFPIAYLWLRREIRPLTEVAEKLDTGDDIMIGLQTTNSTAPSQTIANIVHHFQTFGEVMEEKTTAMSRERMALLASSKVLAHEKNRIQVLLEAIPDAVLSLDETGKVTLANTRAESVLRKSREELIGAPTSVWCPTPDLSRMIGRYSGADGRMLRADSVEFALDDVGQRRFLASVHPLASTGGVAVVIHDISVEFNARKTQAEFLAHMAHELKAPLNVMSLYSESLLGEEAKEEAFRIDACNVIRDEIDRLNSLINNIFSIGRIESGSVALDRQRVRTRELLEDIFTSVSRGAEDQTLDFALELPDPMQPIFVDKQLLSIALKNLLTNAIKYNREGGKVSLVAEEQEGGLSIRVCDTGLGIAEEDVSQVFEKFYRSEHDSVRKVAGHGLGLALVKEIVALHGGEIHVQSELDEGSEFGIFFGQNAPIFREEN